jgi:hypothetical protein
LKTYPILCITLLLALISPRAYAVQPVLAQTVKNPPQVKIQPLNTFTVAAYVRQEAIAYGVNPTDALWIVSHESQDGQNMRGDDGQSRGYWMISDIWHAEVSTACADDLQCSTAWSLKWILAGNISQWSTWSCRYALYPEATSTLGPAPEDYKEPNYCK